MEGLSFSQMWLILKMQMDRYVKLARQYTYTHVYMHTRILSLNMREKNSQ